MKYATGIWTSAIVRASAALLMSCAACSSSDSAGGDHRDDHGGDAGPDASGGSAANGAGGASAPGGKPGKGGASGGGASGASGGSVAAGGVSAAAGAGGAPPPVCDGHCTADCTQGCFDVGACTPRGSASLDLEPNVVTMGVVLTSSAAAEPATLYYRPAGAATWWKGPELVRIPDGTVVGSAFGLSPGTEYDVRVDAGDTTACASATTEALVPAHTTARELWVDAAASKPGDGTSAAPFARIQDALAAAGPGDDVRVRAGVYRESVTFPRDGSEGHFVRLLGEAGAVLDGASTTTSFTWKDEGGGVSSTAWPGDPRYVSRDGKRLYHYLSLDDLKSGTGFHDVPIAEGFFVEGGRLYVRTADAPAGHTFQIPEENTAIEIAGRSWVWVEGLEVRYYGEGDYAKGIDVTEGSTSVVIRKNHVHDVPSDIWVRKGSAQVRIEDNDVHQSTVFSWPWDAVKATDHENDAITLAGGRGAIVAHNTIHDVFNGVYAGSFDDDQNPALAFDVDVYENRLARIGDDGFEPEGACVNARFHDNTVDSIHNGVSLAPITFGPTWVIRNRFTDYQESGFKVSNDTSGRVWLLHNTCFTDAADHNGMNVSGAFSNIVFRNNVIRGTSYAIESTQVVSSNDLDYDALYTTRGAPRVKWNNVRYDDVPALCAATSLECHGVGADPKLEDPGSARYAPSASSPLVDAAERLYGINDVHDGKAPDIGYVERGGTEVPPL